MTLHLSASAADALLAVFALLAVGALWGVIGLLSGRVRIQVEEQQVEEVAQAGQLDSQERCDG